MFLNFLSSFINAVFELFTFFVRQSRINKALYAMIFVVLFGRLYLYSTTNSLHIEAMQTINASFYRGTFYVILTLFATLVIRQLIYDRKTLFLTFRLIGFSLVLAAVFTEVFTAFPRLLFGEILPVENKNDLALIYKRSLLNPQFSIRSHIHLIVVCFFGLVLVLVSAFVQRNTKEQSN
ncbi:MAG: hypothetical protein CFE24_10210 [Flavobacterium sp. BFFFF2]|nr:MAG: hypothetical protein CFE24_10210 [Flavobacterium sp. BFFFF2]